MVLFSNAMRLSMSLHHVPHIALGVEMTEDFDERSKFCLRIRAAIPMPVVSACSW